MRSIYLLRTKLKKEWFDERQFTSKQGNWKRNLTDYLTQAALVFIPFLPWINGPVSLQLWYLPIEFYQTSGFTKGKQ
ncbi:MAG: hypothetical protein C0490_26680 [Marivirga sp.]|nr:hypothetical protein [Marivirga sp.]